MKGQMFFLASVVILVLIVSLLTSIKSPRVEMERKALESSLEKKVFENLAYEAANIPKFMSTHPKDIVSYVATFSNYSRTIIRGRGKELKSLVVSTISNSTGLLNVSVINFLGVQKTVELKLNTSTPQTAVNTLNDTEVWSKSFSITPGEYYVLTVNITQDNYAREVGIATKQGKDVYTGFFDMEMISENNVYRKELSVSFTFS